MSAAVEFEHVSKYFQVDLERPRSFQERFVQLLRRQRSAAKRVDVLQDVSFSLPQGVSLGVIGPNGAGKSTLLKLCARVIEPSAGRVTINGRVAALLELGLGFHPDLTGRENIFLYGSLVGLSRSTLMRRFDEIVAFSEIERFIDMQVKFYSSGMYLRLAFSVAIHIDAEILLIDEAFAVGDAHFQQKCLHHIRTVQAEGATLLFVSHSVELLRSYCSRAIWIENGRVVSSGDVDEVTTAYTEQSAYADVPALLSEGQHRWGSREIEITGARFLNRAGQEVRRFQTGDPFYARFRYIAHQRIPQPVFGIAIYRQDGVHVNGPNTLLGGYEIEFVEGAGSIEYEIDQLNLLPGAYELSVVVYDHSCTHAYDHQHRIYPFWVDPAAAVREQYGTVYLPAHWRLRADE